MKLWIPKWLRQDRQATEAELVDTDRRLFLRGLGLTSAGLVVGIPLISIPKPGPRGYLVVNSPMSDDAVAKLKRALEARTGHIYAGADVRISFGGQPLQVESLQATLMSTTYYSGLVANRNK